MLIKTIMDREINYINEILSSSKEGLTTSEISKIIFEKFNEKVSKTIVKNYLWSYFRTVINYDSSNYTYKLNDDQFLLDDVEVEGVESSVRPISTKFKNSKILIEFDKRIKIDLYIKAIAIMNYKISPQKRNVDLLKQLNRVVEQIENYDE
jgi:hypothetical protein